MTGATGAGGHSEQTFDFQRGFSMPPPRVPRIDTQFIQTPAPLPREDQPWSSYELLPPGLGLDLVLSPRRAAAERERAQAVSSGRAMSLPVDATALSIPLGHTGQVGQGQSPQHQHILGMSPLILSPSPMSEEAPFFSRPGTAN